MSRNYDNKEEYSKYLKELFSRVEKLEKENKEKEKYIKYLQSQINQNEVSNNRRNNEIKNNFEKINKEMQNFNKRLKEIETYINNQKNNERIIKESLEGLKNSIKIKETIKIGDTVNYDHEDFVFVCPICKCRNPHIGNINIDLDERDFNVSFYCACFFKDKEPKSSCLKLLIDKVDKMNSFNLCPIHSKFPLIYFCNKCKKSFCEDCQKVHKDHQNDLVNYTKIMSEDDALLIKMILDKYECNNREIYKKLIKDYFKQFNEIALKYQLKNTIKMHNNRVSSLILLESGLIAIGSYDRSIYIWDLEQPSCYKKFTNWGNALSLLEFKPNKLISGSENYILLWDINSNQIDSPEFSFYNYDICGNCLVKCDNKTFASGSKDGYIYIWEYYNRNLNKKFKLHEDSILALIKLNNGNLCTGSDDKLIKIWNWKTNEIIKELQGHNFSVKCLCQMDDEILLSSSLDGTIKVWKNYECIKTLDCQSESSIFLIKIDNDYFAANFGKEIRILDINEYSCHKILNDHSSDINGLIKRNNNELVSCSYDNTMKIWGEI